MISQETYDRMMRIINLKKFTSQDAKEMEELIKSTFNPTYKVCTYCTAQIKHGQKLMLNFLNITQVEGQELSQEILFPSEPELDVDVEEADKVGCSKCKRKRKVTK
jgi:hypothetical protein